MIKLLTIDDLLNKGTYNTVLKHFPNFDYNRCTEPERLDYRRGDNVVGHQQRAFVIYWAVEWCGKKNESGIEFGSGGILEPCVINTDIRPGSHMQINCENHEDLKQFKDNEFNLIISTHVIEHLSHDIEQLFRKEWLRILKPGGVIAGVLPDAQYGDVMSYDPEHKRAWKAPEFKALLEKMGDVLELIEMDTLNNRFSFNFVAKKRKLP